MKPFPPKPFPPTGYTPPQQADLRNFILEKAQPVQPYPSSYKTDLTALGVYNQQSIPDCVENAVTLVKRYHIYKVSKVVSDLSRRFLAFNTVKLDGFSINNGTSLLNALKSAQKQGISESQYFTDDHSLDETTFSTTIPPQPAINNAATHTIKSYAFLSDLSEQGVKNAIYQNGVVIAGVKIDKNWWTAPNGQVSWQAQDILPIRIPTEVASTTGHCIVFYAYDDAFLYFWNSFSDEWGYSGHGWVGMDYLPYIYEAAVLIDLSEEQISQLKQVTNTLTDVEKIVINNPNSAEIGVISKILVAIKWYLWEIFQ